MENQECNCEECEHWDECEICALLYNPVQIKQFVYNDENVTALVDADDAEVEIKKGDKICQIILKGNKSYLMGIESEEERSGGFGSTGK